MSSDGLDPRTGDWAQSGDGILRYALAHDGNGDVRLVIHCAACGSMQVLPADLVALHLLMSHRAEMWLAALDRVCRHCTRVGPLREPHKDELELPC